MHDDIIKEMLMKALTAEGSTPGVGFDNPIKATEAASNFLEHQKEAEDIQEGDYIERNVYGEFKYKHPDPEKKSVMKVIKKFDEYQYNAAGTDTVDPYNAIAVCMIGEKIAVKYSLDLAYYRKIRATR